MGDFASARRDNCFMTDPISWTGVETKVKKIKNGKAVCKDGVTGERIKIRG